MLKENTEQTETIPIADLEPSLALPPPPPEDEWRPIPEHTNVDGKVEFQVLFIFSLFVIIRYFFLSFYVSLVISMWKFSNLEAM